MLIYATEVEHKVKAVVQVAGLHSLVRIDPQNESRRAWFREVSIAFPSHRAPLSLA
jgi:histone deacetylase 6